MLDPEPKNLRLFAQLDQMRRAWQNVTPCSELSKGDFAMLLSISTGGSPHAVPPPTQLRGGGSITISHLAKVMQRSVPATSQRVRALEESGYVQRTGEVSDRRVFSVCLTPAGETLLQKAHLQFGETLRTALDALAPGEMETLLALLAKLTQALVGVSSETAPPRTNSEKETPKC